MAGRSPATAARKAPAAAKFQPPAKTTGKAGAAKSAPAAKTQPAKTAPAAASAAAPAQDVIAGYDDVTPATTPGTGVEGVPDIGAGIVGTVAVDGVLVTHVEQVLSPLTNTQGYPIYFHTLRLYTLQNGVKVFACADCPEVTGARGEVRVHRVAVHGDGRSGHRKKAVQDDGTVDPARLLTAGAMSMSVGELLRLAAAVDGFEDLLAAVENERDAALTKVVEERGLRLAAEREVARMKRNLAKLLGDGDKS